MKTVAGSTLDIVALWFGGEALGDMTPGGGKLSQALHNSSELLFITAVCETMSLCSTVTGEATLSAAVVVVICNSALSADIWAVSGGLQTCVSLSSVVAGGLFGVLPPALAVGVLAMALGGVGVLPPASGIGVLSPSLGVGVLSSSLGVAVLPMP